MRAHILSIGSELILGHLTDTNATFLAQELVAAGIELLHVTQVGDNRARLANTIRAATVDAGLVICTGGVGPTDDDLTREAIADVVGQIPTVDAALLETVRGFFAGRGLTMPERNAKQAWLIPAAETLPNPVGTAPGWFVRNGQAIIVAMPGVPREMFRMWREQALPRIRPHLPARVFRTTIVKTLGIGESAAAQLLEDLIERPHPIVATYAKDDGIHVHVSAAGSTQAEAVASLAETEREVARRLEPYIYAMNNTSLPTALLALLRARELTIGVAEQGTGGRFGALLAGDPSAGPVLSGAITLPLVPVSDPPAAAKALAIDARNRFDASLGVGLVADLTPADNNLFEGAISIVLSGAAEASETLPVRAAFDDIGRRASMSTADVLRRAIARVGSP